MLIIVFLIEIVPLIKSRTLSRFRIKTDRRNTGNKFIVEGRRVGERKVKTRKQPDYKVMLKYFYDFLITLCISYFWKFDTFLGAKEEKTDMEIQLKVFTFFIFVSNCLCPK